MSMRQLAARLLSGLFAVTWLVLPGFGLIDLSVTWNAEWPQVLEAGWGLFATVIVGSCFGLLAVQPRVSIPATAQLVVATASVAVSAVVASETGLLGWLLSSRCRRRSSLDCSEPGKTGRSSGLLSCGSRDRCFSLREWALSHGSPMRCTCGR